MPDDITKIAAAVARIDERTLHISKNLGDLHKETKEAHDLLHRRLGGHQDRLSVIEAQHQRDRGARKTRVFLFGGLVTIIAGGWAVLTKIWGKM